MIPKLEEISLYLFCSPIIFVTDQLILEWYTESNDVNAETLFT